MDAGSSSTPATCPTPCSRMPGRWASTCRDVTDVILSHNHDDHTGRARHPAPRAVQEEPRRALPRARGRGIFWSLPEKDGGEGNPMVAFRPVSRPPEAPSSSTPSPWSWPRGVAHRSGASSQPRAQLERQGPGPVSPGARRGHPSRGSVAPSSTRIRGLWSSPAVGTRASSMSSSSRGSRCARLPSTRSSAGPHLFRADEKTLAWTGRKLGR